MFPIPLIAAVRACGARSSGADGAIARAAMAAKSTEAERRQPGSELIRVKPKEQERPCH